MLCKLQAYLPVSIACLYGLFIALLLISYDNGAVHRIFYLTAILFAIWCFLKKHFPLNINAGFLAIFLLFTSISTSWSDHAGDIFRSLKHAIYLLLFFSISYVFKNEILTRHRLFKLFVMVCCLSALFNIGWFYRNVTFTTRLIPTWGADNIIDYAGFLSLAVIFSVYLLTREHKQRNRLVYSIMLVVLVAGVVLSQSRMPMLALVLALFTLLLRYKKGLIIYGLLLSLILIGVFSLYPGIISRDAVNGAPSPRIFTWLYVIQQIREHNLWFGFGYGHTFAQYFAPRDITYNNAHGVFSSMLYYTGIIGLLLFLSYATNTFWLAIRIWKQDPLPLALFIFSMIHGISQGYKYLYHPIEIWLVFWFPLFIVAAINNTYTQQKNHNINT